ncbi:GPO family capsid scaffolding protein [uncultured Xylophilus sp.]|uniref:GPO family capsid scaffolding protein n=1 Tax=uncultured Xylophilus sp. TaxID=296832 RepID=UPI0025CE2276|nr:GPO family capsid scaffolding protein [uncultured Xylophilus sp.]
MPKSSKFFRVAVEGATTDGRVIERAWIEQMAASYDAKKYGARVWMEHIRGVVADSPFRAYGDVTALKTEEVEIDGKKKLALFAQIAPLPELVAMTKAGQKVYSSIEVNPKFSDSGQAYLMGLGVTDSPASLGTEILSFAAQHPDASPFAKRKQQAENLFTAATEFSLELEDDDAAEGAMAGLLKGMRERLDKFTGRARKTEANAADLAQAFGDLLGATEKVADATDENTDALKTLRADFAALRKDHTALQAKFDAIDTTDAANHSHRPPATGDKAGIEQTDC